MLHFLRNIINSEHLQANCIWDISCYRALGFKNFEEAVLEIAATDEERKKSRKVERKGER